MKKLAQVGIALIFAFLPGCSAPSQGWGSSSSPPDLSAGSGAGGGSSTGGAAFGSGGTTSAGSGALLISGAPVDSTSTSTSVEATGAGGAPGVSPGVLTAGAWDDNANFQLFLGYQQSIFELQLSGLLTLITIEQQQSAHDAIAYVPTPRDLLDVALVIDTTGSMADELGYLQAEFEAISSAIFAQHPNAQQRWSLVVYRDEGDQYVVRTFAFTTDIKAFQADLAQQSADGGGDYPEAPDQALAAMNTLAWRQSNSVARLAFWVADAPHHAQRADAMASSIQGAQAAGIHVYPVASSGVDDLTELTMRSAAQLTGGRYLFLTDDSGVGGSHKEPTIPCYFVTKLNAAVVRAVDMEMTGVYHLPDTSEIIRTVGDPVQGVCQLVSGSQAVAY